MKVQSELGKLCLPGGRTLPSLDRTKGGSQFSGEVHWEFNNLALARRLHRDQKPVDAPGTEARSSGRSAEK